MSKLNCQCGHIIYDQTDNLPYKAWYCKDENIEDIYEFFIDEIDSFLKANIEGKRNQWIKSKFGKKYSTELDNKSIINDLLISHQNKWEHLMYQCEKCGRIKLETGDDNYFDSFIPETAEQNKELLKSIDKK